MSLREIRVYTNSLSPVHGEWYTLLPAHTIADFEALGVGDLPFQYSHYRSREGHCWECDRPIWTGQNTAVDEDEWALYHEACHWARQSRLEFERRLYAPRYVIAVYDCDRDMGGPEEGGWSYETGRLVLSLEVSHRKAAELIRDGLSLEYPYTGQRGLYSKNRPDFTVYIIDRHTQAEDPLLDCRLNPVDHYPTTIPYYC